MAYGGFIRETVLKVLGAALEVDLGDVLKVF